MKFLTRFFKTDSGTTDTPDTARPTGRAAASATTTARGAAAEQRALEFLQRQGLTLVTRNYRTPGRGGGEIDLVLTAPDGTLIFVEVRQRGHRNFGGAAASIDARKQRRIVLAARHFLLRHPQYAQAPCRFDAVLLDGSSSQATPVWLQAAFMADGYGY